MRRWPLTRRGTGALVVAAISAIAAHELGVRELLFFAVLLSVMVAGAVIAVWAHRIPNARPRRVVPDTATVGHRTQVISSVTTVPHRRNTAVSWQDTVSPPLAADASGTLSWPAGASDATLRYDVTPTARGVCSLGPLTVTTTDPFALARRVSKILPSTPLRVAPAPADIDVLRNVTATAGGAAHATVTQRGQGVDNLLARPYIAGDSMRRIHWRASAHHDDLMVRQEENETAPDATVVLDRDARRWGEGAADAPGADPSFEAAMSTLVSAVQHLTDDGYTVTVCDTDGSALFEPMEPGERALLQGFHSACAEVVADSPHRLDELPRAFGQAGLGPVVIVTGRVDDGDIAELAALRAHTSLVVVLATDPTPKAWERVASYGWRRQIVRVGPHMPSWWDDAESHQHGVAR